MILIKEIKANETHTLRIEILRNGIANNYFFEEDNNTSTFHLGAFHKETCIGIVTFIKDSKKGNTYQLRGMALALKYQKLGIGTQLIQFSYPILKEKNVISIWCNAREIAVDFYTKNGFEIKGEAFNIPNIGIHYIMSKQL